MSVSINVLPEMASALGGVLWAGGLAAAGLVLARTAGEALAGLLRR